MGAIAVVYRDIPSGEDKGVRRGEMKKICVGGREVISVRLLRGRRRYIRRLFDKGNIDALVLRGDVPPFVAELAEERNIAIYDGEKLKLKLLPHIISTYMGDKPGCTVYSRSADKRCEDVIRCASDYFRSVSVSAKEPFTEEFALSIMADTGLSLRIGKTDNSFSILASGETDDIYDVDLESDYGIVFEDNKGNFISVAVVDAIMKDDASAESIFALGLKIHKGLDKNRYLY